MLFTLEDSEIDVYSSTTGDSFDCSKLLNRVEPITQTKPDQTRGKEEKRKKRKRRKKGEKGRKREKKGEKRIKKEKKREKKRK